MAIIGTSHDLKEVKVPELLEAWDKFLQANITDRKIRHVVTGNLLQAFSNLHGKLVSYTTNYNQLKKGILMPENWDTAEDMQKKVVVPIAKALPIIKSLINGKFIDTSNGLVLYRFGNDYRLIISASRSKGGDIYLDPDILELVSNNNFEKTADKMSAVLPEQHIDKLVEILQVHHSLSITIGAHQISDLQKNPIRLNNHKPILLPPVEEEIAESDSDVKLLELEAEALSLELELLAA